MKSDVRFVLMMASEAVPFAKTGGLADVAGALPLALGRRGVRVLLAVPRYRGAPDGERADSFAVTVGGRAFETTFWRRPLGENAEALLVDCPPLFDREGLYGVGSVDYADNALRFACFARAALEFVARDAGRPDVVHAHDWQAGLAPVYLRTLYAAHPVLDGVPPVFTVHNLSYQGLFPPETLPAVDLPWDVYTIEGLEYWGRMSFLKAGINFSRMITTVSRRYAKEIQAPEFGFGFDGILRRRAADLTGIANGIDVERWNPATDPFLPAPYGPGDLSGKAAARVELLRAFDIEAEGPAARRPLVGIVSRMVDQKGFDLLAEVAPELPGLDATFLLLGTGEPRYERLWQDLAGAHPDRIGVRIGFDERLAHLVEGGADLFLMPSRFEPCGLNQMYSQRYGTVPVVRATGGLDDTVVNWNPEKRAGTGFKFREYTARALLRALRAALTTYRKPAEWRVLQRSGMTRDFSWDVSAAQYVKVYEKAMARARP